MRRSIRMVSVEVGHKQNMDKHMKNLGDVHFFNKLTSTGKTFSIRGSRKNHEDRGIIPRTLQYIFDMIKKHPESVYTVDVAYMEIYNENGYDLLDRNEAQRATITRMEDLPRVVIQEDEKGKMHLKNLSFHNIRNMEDAMELFHIGDARRVTAETPMNPQSSRSHCIFTIVVAVKQVGTDRYRSAKMHLVDLAGSERVYKCSIGGTMLTEAKHINLSLHYLEQVIVCLGQEDGGHIPYRNCLLTTVLRDSVGGNCLTTMLATMSIYSANLQETISTCRFAQRVGLVKNNVNLNLEANLDSENALLKLENARLREQINSLTQQNNSSELTEEEKKNLNSQVDRFLLSNESICWNYEPEKIQYCFDNLKKKYFPLEKDDTNLTKKLEYYKDLVDQRDKEISLLLEMLKNEKNKNCVTKDIDDKENKKVHTKPAVENATERSKKTSTKNCDKSIEKTTGESIAASSFRMKDHEESMESKEMTNSRLTYSRNSPNASKTMHAMEKAELLTHVSPHIFPEIDQNSQRIAKIVDGLEKLAMVSNYPVFTDSKDTSDRFYPRIHGHSNVENNCNRLKITNVDRNHENNVEESDKVNIVTKGKNRKKKDLRKFDLNSNDASKDALNTHDVKSDVKIRVLSDKLELKMNDQIINKTKTVEELTLLTGKKDQSEEKYTEIERSMASNASFQSEMSNDFQNIPKTNLPLGISSTIGASTLQTKKPLDRRSKSKFDVKSHVSSDKIQLKINSPVVDKVKTVKELALLTGTKGQREEKCMEIETSKASNASFRSKTSNDFQNTPEANLSPGISNTIGASISRTRKPLYYDRRSKSRSEIKTERNFQEKWHREAVKTTEQRNSTTPLHRAKNIENCEKKVTVDVNSNFRSDYQRMELPVKDETFVRKDNYTSPSDNNIIHKCIDSAHNNSSSNLVVSRGSSENLFGEILSGKDLRPGNPVRCDTDFDKPLPLTGDIEIDEEIIAFYKAKRSGGIY